MRIYRNISEAKNIVRSIVTTGTFDGVHLGHLQVINHLKEAAQKNQGETVILTFNPHPRLILNPDDKSLRLLNTIEEKTGLLEKAGIQHLIIHPFSREFSLLSSTDFVKNILVGQIHTHKLVIGYDHHFGKNREGSFEHLQQNAHIYGFEVEEIPAKDIDNVGISSTRIRKAIELGDLQTANKYLGYEYFISGTVVKGRQLGRSLGYPTANIEVYDRNKLIPADGIYAVKVIIEQKEYSGMMSIGLNPTVDGKNRTVEVNIFDFDKDIYGEHIRVSFFEKLRNEVKFGSLEELKEQLLIDKENTLKVLNR